MQHEYPTFFGSDSHQYATKPNFRAWLQAGLDLLQGGDNTLEQLIAAYDIDSAVGIHLDVLGELLGRRRRLDFQPDNGPDVLDDEHYRLCLKAKVLQNQWDGRMVSLLQMWQSVYAGQADLEIIDYQNMTILARVIGLNSLYQQELIRAGMIVPKPWGVQMDYEFADLIKGQFFYAGALQTGGKETIFMTMI